MLDDIASLRHQLAVPHAARSKSVVAGSLKLSTATRGAGCSHRQGGAVERTSYVSKRRALTAGGGVHSKATNNLKSL